MFCFCFERGGGLPVRMPASIGHWPTWTWAELVYIKSAIQLEFFIAEIMIILEGYGDWVCVDFVSKLFSLHPYIIYNVFDGCLFCLLFIFQLKNFFSHPSTFSVWYRSSQYVFMCPDNCFKSIAELGRVKSSTSTASTNWVITSRHLTQRGHIVSAHCPWYLNHKAACVNRKIVSCGTCNIADVKFVCT